jgi:hypothetical protein
MKGKAMNPREAVTGFAAWLTTRRDRVVMSACDDSAPIAELVKVFCDENGLEEISSEWPSNLIHPSGEVAISEREEDEDMYFGNFGLRVSIELEGARRKHGPIKNLHEGYAVILEEVDELWERVRLRNTDHVGDAMAWKELVQIAAMAQRVAEDVVVPDLTCQVLGDVSDGE